MAVLVVLGGVLLPLPPAEAAVTPCSTGLVALTFDDGPARVVTPRLVRMLRSAHVPATFFMVGSRVRSAPAEGRLAASRGFVVANHTWSHARLTGLSNAGIRAELVSTRSELQRRGLHPSRLMRPPYGATNARVNAVARRLGLVPVLWTVDSQDWQGGTSAQIAARVLARLRPHRTNIVLQHDGVRRSPTSVAAVPQIIRSARARGYCFTTLDSSGRPAVPVPDLRMTVSGGREAGRVPATVTLRLTQPTSRRVSVRLRTVGGSATSGADFVPVARTVTFPVGAIRVTVRVPVVDDAVVEGLEHLIVRLDSPSGVRVPTRTRTVSIASDDTP